MKKLLLSIILAIPVMGYCGFIDWITGYPEVKEKLVQRLTEKYNGDKFEVLDLEYSYNLKGYNFKAKDISKDLTAEGSYFPKTGVIWGNGFKKQMMQKDLEKMLKPFILQVSDNYTFIGSASYAIPRPLTKEKSKEIDNILGYQFEDGVDLQKWIKKYHKEQQVIVRLKIQSKRDPQSIYKVIKMIYDINNYLRSLKLGKYILDIETFNVPKGFNIKEWYKVKYENRNSVFTTVNPDKDLYKYAWGYLDIISCPPSPKWGSACRYEKLDIMRSHADKIHSLNDVTKYLEMYDYGKPTVEVIIGQSGRKYVHTYWKAGLNKRKVTPLDQTKYYPAVEKLILADKK